MTPHVFALLFPKLWTLSTFLYFLIIHHCVFVASSFSLNNDKSLLLFFLQGKKSPAGAPGSLSFFKPINHAVNLRVISVETLLFFSLLVSPLSLQSFYYFLKSHINDADCQWLKTSVNLWNLSPDDHDYRASIWFVNLVTSKLNCWSSVEILYCVVVKFLSY